MKRTASFPLSAGAAAAAALVLAFAGPGCAGDIGVAGGSGGGGAGGLGSGGRGGSTGDGGNGGYVVPASAYLPARIRRLTNAEYDASAKALLGTTMSPSVQFSFPPDARQGPTSSPAGPAFTLNDAQRVDPVLADKLDTAALALVAEARANGKLAALAPCPNPTGAAGEACAKTFAQTFGQKAYRRPLVDDEINGLVVGPKSPYHMGADGYTYNDGIDVVTRVLLQSAGFLYITEIGDTGAGATFTLTPTEIAMSMSYLLTAGPPDDALVANASAGMLATSAGREQEARRLIGSAAGRGRMVRVVREWLGIDDVAHREKASSLYPGFAAVSAAMEAESTSFIGEVLTSSSGTIEELLGADWTIVDSGLASVYGVTSAGSGKRTSLGAVGRRGILNQAAFLSVFATNNGSHPVFRGVSLMRRVACLSVPDPGVLGIVVSFPAADTTKTTRARFEQHARDTGCANCHASIDAIGFAFERYDGMGQARSTENGLAVDSKVTIQVGSDFDGTYADSDALAMALASSANVRTCLARQLFRSSAGRSDATIAASENAFVELWKQLPADQQGKVADVLMAYVRSPLFTERRTP
jgi:hypothetical protein